LLDDLGIEMDTVDSKLDSVMHKIAKLTHMDDGADASDVVRSQVEHQQENRTGRHIDNVFENRQHTAGEIAKAGFAPSPTPDQSGRTVEEKFFLKYGQKPFYLPTAFLLCRRLEILQQTPLSLNLCRMDLSSGIDGPTFFFTIDFQHFLPHSRPVNNLTKLTTSILNALLSACETRLKKRYSRRQKQDE
uniref:Non-specific serine/threonine protein kinase n=1 Tax=Angiostrongylus cantonensis TaxID=6313 RepID=A0A0K0DI84_ANGCA